MFEVLKNKVSLKLRYVGDERHLRWELGMLKSHFGSQTEKSFSCVLFTKPGKRCLS